MFLTTIAWFLDQLTAVPFVHKTVICPLNYRVYKENINPMSEQSTSEEDEPVVLDTLPAAGVSMDIVDTLNEGDVFDIVGPLVIDTHTDRITHLNLVVNNMHHFVGWNPTNERWEQIVVVEEQEDEDDETVALKTAISMFDDETEEPVLVFDGPAEPSTEDIVAFVWEYVEHTNPNTDHLYNVMDEALEEL